MSAGPLEPLVKVLTQIPTGLSYAAADGLRVALRSGLALDAQRAASQRGIVRGILFPKARGFQGPLLGKWKVAGSGLYKVQVKANPPRGAVGLISAVGIAKLQEVGGRTKPHDIRANRGHVLWFQVAARRGRGFADTRNQPVRHPGSVVRRYPALAEAWARGQGRIQAEVAKAIARVAGRFGAAA